MALAHLVVNERVCIGLEQRVVKAAEFRQLQDAVQVIGACQTIMDDLRQEAQAEFEEARQRGYAQGQADAAAQAGEWLAAAERQLSLYLDRLDATVTDLALQLVRAVGPRLVSDELVADWIREGLQHIRSDRYLRFRVHPENRAAAEQCLDHARAAFPRVELFDVVADPSLERAAVTLESDLGTVTASLGQRIEALAATVNAAAATAEQQP